jgi:hypothetical protein
MDMLRHQCCGSSAFYPLDSGSRSGMNFFLDAESIIFMTIETCSWNHKEQEKRYRYPLFLFSFFFLSRIWDKRKVRNWIRIRTLRYIFQVVRIETDSESEYSDPEKIVSDSVGFRIWYPKYFSYLNTDSIINKLELKFSNIIWSNPGNITKRYTVVT